MTLRSVILSLLILCALGCSPAPLARPPVASGGQLRHMMHDAAASGLLCERLRGKLISLPEEGGPGGATGAMVPNIGSLWMQSCLSRATDERLELDISGIGWMWVDEQSHGFRVSQYVYFNVSARLRGVLDLGYDAETQLASVWFSPSRIEDVRVTPLGELNAEPQTLLAEFISITPIALAIPAIARQAAGEQGASRFRERLGQGATVTYSLPTQHYDMSLGHLPRGVQPQHPFDSDAPWWVNERHHVRPSGMHVVGPFPAQTSEVETVLEHGALTQLRAVCERDLVTALSGITQPAAPGRVAPLGQRAVFQQIAVAPERRPTRVQPSCRWYLALTAEGPQPVGLALRVAPLRFGGPSLSPPPAQPHGPHAVIADITLVAVSVVRHKPDGSPWDVALFGPAPPDPAVTFRQRHARDHVLFTATDSYEATATVRVPHPVELTESDPALFMVVDRDMAAHDTVGTAQLGPAQALRGGELELPLLDGQRRRMGSVRVVVDVKQVR